MSDNATNKSQPFNAGGHYIDPLITKVLYIMIGTIAVCGNGLICSMFIANRSLFNHASSKLILSLAVIDGLTGVTILIAPNTVLKGQVAIYPGTSAYLYCALYQSFYFFWSFGTMSLYFIAAIGVERWYMIAKPTKYKTVFTKRKVNIIIICIIIIGIILNSSNIYQRYHQPGGNVWCGWRSLPIGITANRILYIFLFTFKFLLPITVTFSCYISILITFHKSSNKVSNGSVNIKEKNRRMMKQLTLMAFTSAFAYFICWAPNQIYFTLFNFKVVKYDTITIFVNYFLVMVTSSLNPFIYLVVNKYYRQQCKTMINKLIMCCRPNKDSNFGGLSQKSKPTNCTNSLEPYPEGPLVQTATLDGEGIRRSTTVLLD